MVTDRSIRNGDKRLRNGKRSFEMMSVLTEADKSLIREEASKVQEIPKAMTTIYALATRYGVPVGTILNVLDPTFKT